MPATVNILEAGHVSEPNDCAILSLSAYLGIPYTDVIRIAARLVEDGGKGGLTLRTMRRIADLCGSPLTIRRTFDPAESYGIVFVQWRGHHEGHAAMLREGHVADRNALWEWDDWHAHMAQLVVTKTGKPRTMTCRLLVATE